MSHETEVKTTAICCFSSKCDFFRGIRCCSWSNCCSLRFHKKGLKQLKNKALSALCLGSPPSTTSTLKSSSPVNPNPNPNPPLVVAPLDSHRTEAVKACIEYINATSSSSSSSSASSGPKPDSTLPSK